MKDNLQRTETSDIMSDDTDWLTINGMRHSIRARRTAPANFARELDDMPISELLTETPQPEQEEAQDPVDTKNENRDAASMPDAAICDAEHLTREAAAIPEQVNVKPARIIPASVARAQTEMLPKEHTNPATNDVPQWEDLPLIEAGARRAYSSVMPVVDASRDSLSVQAFDLLRTRLRRTTQENGWINIAVTAPTRGCGTTFTALNLALSLSRIPESRTILMDLNLRNPGLAQALDVPAPGEMRDFLSGNVPVGEHLQRISDTLALGLNSIADQDAAETLQNPALSRTLDRMRAALRPDLVVFDMPPMLGHDDVSAFLPELDGVLLVSDGTQTMAKQLLECERMLDGQVPLLGVVLNRARASSLTRYR